MTILNPSDQKTPKGKSSAMVGLVVILVLGGIFAYNSMTDGSFTEHSVIDDLDGLIYGFDSLMYGDIDGFFDGILDSMVVVGLFMVMFALVHFIISTTMKHIFSSKALQLTMSLVISVYAFINYRIYNFLISLNAFMVGFLVFCAVVIMLWGFSRHSYRSYKESALELHKAKEVAKNQYLSKGYVDGDILKHIRNLQKEINDAKRKYESDIRNANN